MLDLHWLFALFSRTKRNKSAVKQNSLLLDLPIAIVYDIFDVLHLPEKILLSQTCRDLWCLLHYKCFSAIREAPVVERLKCLTVLGDILPDHRLCTYCRVLHLVDIKDVPITGYDKYYMPCPAPETTWSRHRLSPYYAIAFRHVQLAMKYTRLEGIHQDYRASILQKFTIFIPKFWLMGLEFTAEPAIIYGRFILTTTFTFHETTGPLSCSTLSRAYIRFCPHFSTYAPLNPDNPLRAAIRFAFDVKDGQCGSQQEVNSCDQCPTDYSITVKDRRATLYVWQDLGSGNTPTDPHWRSHIQTEENNSFKGTKFSYEHGSIRELCYSSST